MLTSHQVIVIEDDEDIRLATLEFLAMEGIPAVGCMNGKDALEYLRSPDVILPKLILSDLAMPVMNGYAFREAQLADPKLRDIPVVVMSADGALDPQCRALGVKQSIAKPVDLDELLALIRKHVGS